MIQLLNVSKSFGEHHLFENLSLTLKKGVNLIEGKSGTGKTTLINIMMGMEKPDCGNVYYEKENVVFAYSGQDESLFRNKTATENLHELNPDIDENRFSQLIDELKFHSLDKRIDHLSGGERQKVEIAFCLAKEADVYILDEPFSSLDEESKNRVVKLLNKLGRDKYIVLVNHDQSVDALRVEQRINLNSHDESVSKTFMYENSIKKKSRTLFAVKNYFSSQLMYSVIKTVLTALCFVFFALGLSFLNLKSQSQRMELLLSQDPFSVHALRLGNIGSESELSTDFFEYASLSGRQYLTLTEQKTHNEVTFYGGLDKDEKTIYSYSNYETKAIQSNQDVLVNDLTYQLEVISAETLDSLLPVKSKFIQSMIDGYANREIILCSNQLIDEILLASSSIHFSVDDLGFYEMPGYSFSSSEGMLTTGLAALSINVIEDRTEYYLSLPGDYVGQVIEYNNLSRLKLTVDDSSLDGMIHLSLPLLKFLFMHETSVDREESNYGYEFEDDEIVKMMQSYSSLILPFDIYYDYSNTVVIYVYLFFPLSLVFLVAELFFVFFTRKAKQRWYQNIRGIYQRNMFDDRSLNKGLMLSSFIESFLGLVLSLVLYVFLFIPNANEYFMKNGITDHPTGYYYYSQQPLNPYYDSIEKPMTLITFEPVFFLLFLIMAFICLVNFICVTKKKKPE